MKWFAGIGIFTASLMALLFFQNFSSVVDDEADDAASVRVAEAWMNASTPMKCPTKSIYSPISFNQVAGVRTRWESVLYWTAEGRPKFDELAIDPRTGLPIGPNDPLNVELKKNEVSGDGLLGDRLRGERSSLTPNLGNLWLSRWAQALIDSGANVGELNLDPTFDSFGRRLLAADGTGIAADDFIPYLRMALRPASRRADPQDVSLMNKVRANISGYDYTPQQRNQALIFFLARLEALRNAGRISGDFRFFIHQRAWFPERPDEVSREDYSPERLRQIDQFSTDMADLINMAHARCLDHLIAGIRLGEHSNAQMTALLPIIVKIAQSVNLKTGGWLKNRMLLINGGGWGPHYRGIARVDESHFFLPLSQETQAFAFGYKWMAFADKNGQRTNMQAEMETYQCGNHRCNSDSVDDWKLHLGQNFGFNELTTYVNGYAAKYPNHANVIFVGDSSDSILGLTKTTGQGVLTDRPALAALRELFQAATLPAQHGGWKGKLFMLFANTPEGNNDPRGDNGLSLFNEETTASRLNGVRNEQSYQIWKRGFQ